MPQCSPVNVVVEFELIFPISVTASSGYPRSFIIARSRAWSRKPNAFLKSMYRIYMS